MNSHLLLSIVIPLYNTEKYIDQCISSIIDTEVDKSLYEVIVIDDGSSDTSSQIVQKYCFDHPNISLYTQENSGVSVARMNGVAHAKGAFIWFIDSDDYVTDNAVNAVIDLIQHYADIDVFVTPMCLSFQDDSQNFVTHELEKRYVISGKDLMKRKDFFLIGPPQFIVRSALFSDQWLFFPKGIRYEDEYYARVLKYRAEQFLILEKYLYVYRQWNGSHMHSVNIDVCSDVLSVYRYLDSFAKHEVAEEDLSWFRNNIVSFLFEAITRGEPFFGSQAFNEFYHNNIEFIQSEWKKYKCYFSLKDRMLAGVLLKSPRLYSLFLARYRSFKVSKSRQ